MFDYLFPKDHDGASALMIFFVIPSLAVNALADNTAIRIIVFLAIAVNILLSLTAGKEPTTARLIVAYASVIGSSIGAYALEGAFSAFVPIFILLIYLLGIFVHSHH